MFIIWYIIKLLELSVNSTVCKQPHISKMWRFTLHTFTLQHCLSSSSHTCCLFYVFRGRCLAGSCDRCLVHVRPCWRHQECNSGAASPREGLAPCAMLGVLHHTARRSIPAHAMPSAAAACRCGVQRTAPAGRPQHAVISVIGGNCSRCDAAERTSARCPTACHRQRKLLHVRYAE